MEKYSWYTDDKVRLSDQLNFTSFLTVDIVDTLGVERRQ